jgi:hypothetical protein
MTYEQDRCLRYTLNVLEDCSRACELVDSLRNSVMTRTISTMLHQAHAPND